MKVRNRLEFMPILPSEGHAIGGFEELPGKRFRKFDVETRDMESP
jgi:hypothetical protein